jgi:hypothetical protein
MGNSLRESAEFPTGVKEVMTLLVKLRRSIVNAMGVGSPEEWPWSLWLSNLVWKTACLRILELTNRGNHGHVWTGGLDTGAEVSHAA